MDIYRGIGKLNAYLSFSNLFNKIRLIKTSQFLVRSYHNYIRRFVFSMVLLFLCAGGLIGYLLYRSITSLDKKDKNLSLEELLEKGESEAIEYKSSLRWDYRQNKTSKELEFSVLKTIAAFMNTRKGTLLIGVADDGAIVGLENDYQSLKKKNRDGFEQHMMELVALSIGTDCCKNIRVTFFERHDKDIKTHKIN